MDKQVEHEGTVASIVGNTMTVRIVTSAACNGCAARHHCLPSESNERDISIAHFSGEFALGERVRVVMRQSQGFRALCLGYIVPCVLVLATLLSVHCVTGNELASGLSALFILVPYWLFLRLLHRKITQSFGFTVQKMNIT